MKPADNSTSGWCTPCGVSFNPVYGCICSKFPAPQANDQMPVVLHQPEQPARSEFPGEGRGGADVGNHNPRSDLGNTSSDDINGLPGGSLPDSTPGSGLRSQELERGGLSHVKQDQVQLQNSPSQRNESKTRAPAAAPRASLAIRAGSRGGPSSEVPASGSQLQFHFKPSSAATRSARQAQQSALVELRERALQSVARSQIKADGSAEHTLQPAAKVSAMPPQPTTRAVPVPSMGARDPQLSAVSHPASPPQQAPPPQQAQPPQQAPQAQSLQRALGPCHPPGPLAPSGMHGPHNGSGPNGMPNRGKDQRRGNAQPSGTSRAPAAVTTSGVHNHHNRDGLFGVSNGVRGGGNGQMRGYNPTYPQWQPEETALEAEVRLLRLEKSTWNRQTQDLERVIGMTMSCIDTLRAQADTGTRQTKAALDRVDAALDEVEDRESTIETLKDDNTALRQKVRGLGQDIRGWEAAHRQSDKGIWDWKAVCERLQGENAELQRQNAALAEADDTEFDHPAPRAQKRRRKH